MFLSMSESLVYSFYLCNRSRLDLHLELYFNHAFEELFLI